MKILMTSLQLLPWTSEYHLLLENFPLKTNLHSFLEGVVEQLYEKYRRMHGPGQRVCWTFASDALITFWQDLGPEFSASKINAFFARNASCVF